MHHGIRSAQGPTQLFLIGDVRYDALKSLYGAQMTGREIIVNHNFMTLPGQLPHRVAANVTSPAGYEHAHVYFPLRLYVD